MLELQKKAKIIEESLIKNKILSYEILLENKKGVALQVENQKRKNLETKQSCGFSVRFVKDNVLSFFYGTDFSVSAIDSMIQKSLASLKFKSKTRFKGFDQKFQMNNKNAFYDPEFENYSAQNKLDLLLQLEAKGLAYNKKIKKIVDCSFDDEFEELFFLNSAQQNLFQEKSISYILFMPVAQSGDSEEVVQHVEFKTKFKELETSLLTDNACQHALDLLNGKTLASYNGPVIIHHGVMAEILEVLVSSFYGDNVSKGNSFFQDQINKRVFAKNITLIDDGVLENGLASSLFDSEGTPKQKQILVGNGVLQKFLYDNYWGQICKTQSTGNSSKENLLSLPKISANNFYLKPGTHDMSSLYEQMQDGILITDVIGMHMADSISGDVSVGVQGLRIKNAKKDHAIKGMVLTANLFQILNQDVLLGSDLKFFGQFGSPSVLFDRLTISGA